MSKRVAIVQSNYLPWIGYFDLMNSVDEFVLYDEVQYTRRDWRNRNKVKTPDGPKWLTIPVESKGNYFQPISAVLVSEPRWFESHWKNLSFSYARAKFFEETTSTLQPIFDQLEHLSLSSVNSTLLKSIANRGGIRTEISDSLRYPGTGNPSERLANICVSAGASAYVSGPAAKAYLDPTPFNKEGIEIEFFRYPEYPAYNQQWGPFVPNLSVIDFIFNHGWSLDEYLADLRR